MDGRLLAREPDDTGASGIAKVRHPRTMPAMQSLLFLVIGLALLALLTFVTARRGPRGLVASPLALGAAIGLIGAFAVLPVAVDVVPDVLEPVGLAVGIAFVSIVLALLGGYALPGRRGRP